MNNGVLNKVSFDFDSTLDRPEVQAFATYLIDQGFEVWVTTSRGTDEEMNKRRLNPETWKNPPNHELYEVTDRLGIPRDQIKFTAWVDKWTVLKGEGFIFHLDDDEVEIEQAVEHNCDCPFIWIDWDWNPNMPMDWRSACEGFLVMNSMMYELMEG